MDKQVHKCPAKVYPAGSFRGHTCLKTASHEHKGVMYCKTHHPPSVQAKREKKHAEWQAAWQGKRNAEKAEADKRAEQKRRADCFPDLLEALNLAQRCLSGSDDPTLLTRTCEAVDAAIAKATGETT